MARPTNVRREAICATLPAHHQGTAPTQVVGDAAAKVGVQLDVVGATRRTYEEALQLGFAAEHKGATAKVCETRAGVIIGPKGKASGGSVIP